MDEKFFSAAKFLGLEHTSSSGDERICTCVLCLKERHLYWNEKKGVGHCKVCDAKFTKMGLLQPLIEGCQAHLEDRHLEALAKNRSLPVEAFEPHGFGYIGGWYVLPVLNEAGKLATVRRFKLGGPMLSLGGCETALFGLQHIDDPDRATDPIYVCEGEWDAISLEWLRAKAGRRGIVLGVPGASTFKLQWRHWFQGRDVYLAYDNDEAGRKGAERAIETIGSIAASVHVIEWSETLPQGFDIRDFITRRIERRS